jgi:hypothetical protein
MLNMVRNIKSYPALTLGAVVLWGMFEYVALQRARSRERALDNG